MDKHNLQYTEYYGDGDSKGFTEVEDTYVEEDVKVVKKECVGHVQKRLGTALREFKRRSRGEKLDDGKSVGEKNRLTDQVIDRMRWGHQASRTE